MQLLKKTIRSWQTMEQAFEKLALRTYPYTVQGLSGGLFAFFLAEYVHRFDSNLCIVVPTEKEIEELRADLDIAGLQAEVLPWWGNIAYRPVPAGAPVFAERSQVLARLCNGNKDKTVTVMTQRAFLTE